MMRAAFLVGYGADQNIELGDVPEPSRKANFVLIDVKAAGVNPVEVEMRAGNLRAVLPYSFPQVPGFDVSGVVREAPADSRFKPGDEVYARLPNHAPGAYAERAVVPEALLTKKPVTLSHVDAASLPTIALTTWQSFFERARLKRGERILIHAGAGGVGTFAIQLAKHIGAHVTATASSSNLDLLHHLGADRAVDYTHERFEHFGPYDVIYDCVGGDLIERSILGLAPGGRYVGLVYTADALAYASLGLPEALAKKAAAGVAKYVELAKSRGTEFHGPLTRPDGAQLAEIAALVDAGRLKPFVSRVFALDELDAAYSAIATGHTRGKLVVDVAGLTEAGG